MKISVCNGSPRGKNSNSTFLIKWLNQGFEMENKQHLIALTNTHDAIIDDLTSADKIVIVFPLYTDAMPGIVMAFIEKMFARKDELTQKNVLFIVHSGFSEALHSYPVKAYLENLNTKFNFKSIQVVIQGGSEGTRLMPENAQKKKIAAYEQIAAAFKKDTKLPAEAIALLEKPYRYSKFTITVMTLLNKTGLTNIYWNSMLKKNNAFDQRFDTPYKK